MNLILSLAALVLGPVIYGACRKVVSVRSALDGLLFVTIAGIVIVYIVPDTYAVAGPLAIAFLVAGALVAFLVERQPDLGGKDRYTWIILLGALGLIIHALMDGIALIPGDHLDGAAVDGHLDLDGHDEVDGHAEHGQETALEGLFSNHLALGVILHRVPVGMAIWWTLRPRLGRPVAIGALLLIVVATSAAYLLGAPVIELMEVRSVAFFQAFVAGTLMHVIVFSSVQRNLHVSEESQGLSAVGERIGVIIGLILLFLVPHAH